MKGVEYWRDHPDTRGAPPPCDRPRWDNSDPGSLDARTPRTDLSVRSATARLAQEFPELSPVSIRLVVRTCREELRGSPTDALPELVERLARQRLRVELS